jgi:TatA/E family protein of Tat protein translocase
MFGIGPGEMIVLLVILLIAVGPKGMPKLMKAVGRGMREFRKATDDLRQQVGLDELMRDEEWRDPLGLRKPLGTAAPSPSRDRGITAADRLREYPPEGVDVRHAFDAMAASLEQKGAEGEGGSAGEAKGEGGPGAGTGAGGA